MAFHILNGVETSGMRGLRKSGLWPRAPLIIDLVINLIITWESEENLAPSPLPFRRSSSLPASCTPSSDAFQRAATDTPASPLMDHEIFRKPPLLGRVAGS